MTFNAPIWRPVGKDSGSATGKVNIYIAICLLSVSVGLFGCGSSGTDRPGVAHFSGTVTYKGEPVAGASVAFQPLRGGRAASGETDAAGAFKMSTFDLDDGVVPGSYGITVDKYPVPEAVPAPEGLDEENPDLYVEPPEPKNELPAKYEDPSTSGLSVEVKEGEAVSDFKIELTD